MRLFGSRKNKRANSKTVINGSPGSSGNGGSASRRVEGQDGRLNLLYDIGKQASSVSEISTLINYVMKMTEQTLRASTSSILLLDEEKQELYFEYADGDIGQTLKQMRMSIHSGVAGWVARHGEPVTVNNVKTDDRFYQDVDKATGFTTRSLMCAPMIARGRTIGVIEVLNKLDGSDFNKQDLEALVSVASTAAMAIDSKQSEEALRASEDHYAALVSSLTDMVFLFREGTVTWCNDMVEKICGYKKGELIGKDISIFFPPDINAESLGDKIHKEIEIQGSFYDVGKMKKKGGDPIDIEYTVSQIKGRDPIELVAVVRDITERVQAEEEKHRMEQQLQLTGRLVAVGELAAGVAHELNNPLAAVQGFAQLLAQRKNLDEEIKIDVDAIYTEARRATKITSNLLSFARKHKPEKRFISINDALAESLDLHAYPMRVNNVETIVELAPDLPKVKADYHQMQQIFVNLIGNAQQAMTEFRGSGTLIVKTTAVDDMVRITFTDDGPGIEEENIDRIFDPFFTTKEVGKGTGLGLSICYGLVREHDGRLYVENRSGLGATFVVEIPIANEEESELEQNDSGLSK